MTNAACAVYNYIRKIEMQNFEQTKNQFLSGEIEKKLIFLISRCEQASERKHIEKYVFDWMKVLGSRVKADSKDTMFLWGRRNEEALKYIYSSNHTLHKRRKRNKKEK